MTTIAVVPVQRLPAAKTRLADHLDPAERRALVLAMLDRVLGAMDAALLVDQAIVVSPDPDVLAFAQARHADGILQTTGGLNAAIRLGRDAAQERGAETLLVTLGDLPLLRGVDVDSLVAAAPDYGFVLAPDRHQRGTNALVATPPSILDPAFGADSLRRHRGVAAARGLSVREYRSLATAFDLDTVTDLAELDRVRTAAGGPLRRGAPATEWE